ncbi:MULTISPECIES: ATP-binding protein [unclassified Hydrogenobaculum]|uniref:ATP-binding protein n=1 Tax=unclassified Hydrogenobaculum TaxID=2622382 RepID=UPI001ED945D0|nr:MULTISPECIES: ATP-binding protein [unclassified Hydrogenobaculum]
MPKLTSKYYFLSRPRRFGKSLFLDTLKEAFSGNKELFKGLYLYDNWDWEKRYPIIKLDLSQAYPDTEENLIKSLDSFLKAVAKEHQITLEEEILGLKFKELIQKLYEKYNQKVVVLIDEYDKPILDVIEDIEKARRNRDILKKFFEILKPSDPYLKLAFLTGVSRFSKVSIFSGLNQLNDITIDPSFATVCGYTQSELESVFEDRLKDFDKEKIKVWYNGYAWLGESVYNPFDILLLFDKKMFKPYWFETGTPTFLIKMFMKNRYYIPELENLEVGDEILSNLDVDNIRVENLLFQAGYLTIKEFKTKGNKNLYTLSFPNLEVKMSFNDFFLGYVIENISLKDKTEIGLIEAFENRQVEKLKDILHRFFASIPHDWYRKNDIDSYEGFYASIVYALFNGAGLNVIAEDNTSKGQIDLSVFNQDSVYIIEFKVVEDKEEGVALKQIKEKRYYEKYKGKYQEIYLIGIEFSKKDKNIVSFEWEKI